MQIDIRSLPAVQVITSIRFANNDHIDYVANIIKKAPDGVVEIADSDSARMLRIKNAEQADNLIKALEKAKELGWFN